MQQQEKGTGLTLSSIHRRRNARVTAEVGACVANPGGKLAAIVPFILPMVRKNTWRVSKRKGRQHVLKFAITIRRY